ncbi:MAG: hypothetical protein KKD44_06650, partial [Proteobacteria bacterium]|nr:hypothetical protein [Pseudomonadota bacterium]
RLKRCVTTSPPKTRYPVDGLPSGTGFSPARLHDLARPHYSYAPNVWGWVDPLGLSCKEQANVHVAYHPNKPVGHNVIGIELPKEQTQWYDLVMTENPGGTTGLMKGGQGTTLRKQLNLSSKYKISTRSIDIDKAKSMLSKSEDLLNSDTGPYKLLNNSCTSTVTDILNSGGVKPAWWAKTPSLLYKWF